MLCIKTPPKIDSAIAIGGSTLDVPNMTGTWQAVIKQQVDGDWVTIAAENITTTGQTVVDFTRSVANAKLEVVNLATGISSISFEPAYEPINDTP